MLLSDSVTSSFLELDGTVELLQDVQGWCRGNLRGGDGPRRMMRGTPPGGETAERCLRLGQAAARRMCSFFPWLYYFWYWTLTDVCLFQQNRSAHSRSGKRDKDSQPWRPVSSLSPACSGEGISSCSLPLLCQSPATPGPCVWISGDLGQLLTGSGAVLRILRQCLGSSAGWMLRGPWPSLVLALPSDVSVGRAPSHLGWVRL